MNRPARMRARTALRAELGALIEEAAQQRIAQEPAAVEAPRHVPNRARLWTCPICWTRVYSRTAPLGWLVVEPFTRVAACAACRPHFDTESPQP